ncbi:phosphotransferase family protein [Micromonospora chalcea]|uniref:phosphotransferase family protein n=1 Tax=Micromonospora chalcea TaxID=1874 RepID=UPI003D71D77F
MRSDWTCLPETVRAGIAARLGGAVTVTPAPAGNHAEIASMVTGPAGRVFIKAGQQVPSLRYELAGTLAGGSATGYAPAVRWHEEAGDWLVVASEPLDGPHADLSPGSPDLDLLAVALKELQEASAPAGAWYTPAGRLGFTSPAMEGLALVHSDLNPANLIVTRDGLRIVDWAWVTRAAPWVELALLTQWLIGCGHTPAQAEGWLAQFPAWGAAGDAALDHFATRNAAKWSAKAQQRDDPWVRNLAAWTSRWATYRRG